MKKKALNTYVTGQDDSYLARFVLEKGELETLLSGPSEAKNELGWVPEIILKEMCA